jgi:hypothetical protein
LHQVNFHLRKKKIEADYLIFILIDLVSKKPRQMSGFFYLLEQQMSIINYTNRIPIAQSTAARFMAIVLYAKSCSIALDQFYKKTTRNMADSYKRTQESIIK